MNQVPLFVTRYSTSPKTAVGVQTQFLTQEFKARLHLYWTTDDAFWRDPLSMCLETLPVARFARLRYSGVPYKLIQRLGLTWWMGDVLRPARRQVVEQLRERVSHVYLAPLDASDAARMRQIVEILDKPFLVHLWDFLSGPLSADANMVWLLKNARRTLVVSRPLEDEIVSLGINTDILLFTRPPSAFQASFPLDEVVRLAVLGNLAPYRNGLVMLDKAIDLLSEKGVRAEIVHIGSKKLVEAINPSLRHKLVSTGFLTDAERDQKLATCHFGFVPGPAKSPETDMRSRYSIPSRSLDFLAAGLPMLGTVHSESATGRFYREFGVGQGVFCHTAPDIAEALIKLSKLDRWRAEAERNMDAFARLTNDSPAQKLLREMNAIT